MTVPLFAWLLGDAYPRLPLRLRELHGFEQGATWRGRAQITRGASLLSRLAGAVAGLPPAGQDVPTSVRFARTHGGETWARDFGSYVMRSRLWARSGLLCERLGPMELGFALSVCNDAIHWRVQRARLLGLLPLPAAWFRGVQCREYEETGRYAFLVEAGMPLLGPLVRYQGWLEHG